MKREPDDPLGAALLIAEAFERRGISYAIGGALAYGLWGIPRATIDVDVNVFCDEGKLTDVLDALLELGAEVRPEGALAAARQRGLFIAQLGLFRIDVFTPSIDFCWEAERTKVIATIEGQQVSFLSAEAIAVFKLLFFRAKDLVDLQRLLAVQQGRLDHEYVRGQVVGMMGEDDERVLRWDALVAEHASSPPSD